MAAVEDGAALSHLISHAYTLHESLGSGGFGEVYLATHLLTGEKVAIKAIDKNMPNQELKRAYREVRTLKCLNHPYIYQIYQVIENDKFLCIVFEYCSNGELFDYIVNKKILCEDEARVIFAKLVVGLSYIHHQGFAHRDLKPENIMLDENNNPKIIDFGLCAKPKGSLEGLLTTCCGSPMYAAPELLDKSCYSPREADIWSCGVILYVLVHGTLPFKSSDTENLLAEINARQYKLSSNLSFNLVSLIYSFFETNPNLRITVKEILQHPWFSMDPKVSNLIRQAQKINDFGEKLAEENLDFEIVDYMSKFFVNSRKQIISAITSKSFDYVTTTYFLLERQKKMGKEMYLNPNFVFSKLFTRSIQHMANLLKEQRVKKHNTKFKKPLKPTKQNDIKNGRYIYKTPTKHVQAPLKKNNNSRSCPNSPSSKILENISRYITTKSPLKVLFQDKNEKSSPFKSLTMKSVKNLDYDNKISFLNVKSSKDPKKLLKFNEVITHSNLVEYIEQAINSLNLVFVRNKDLFLVEKISNSYSNLPCKNDSMVKNDNFSEETITVLKFTMEIVSIANKDRECSNPAQEPVEEKLAVKFKKLSGNVNSYKVIYSDLCRKIINAIAESNAKSLSS